MAEEREASGLAWVRAFWRALRPEFWLVTIFPLYMGWVLASRELWPGLGVWLDLWSGAAARGGATPAEVLEALARWARVAWPFLAGLACVGPLVWGSTLLYNNYRDLREDRANPRRRRDPLVLGQVTGAQALWGARVLGALGLLVAAAVGPFFLAAMAACLALSWAYSAPPLRLKGRAGFDVLVNVVGVGLLCTLAGWSLAAPLGAFPWPFLLLPVLLLASAYIPTTLVDHDTDRAFGVRTLAVALGPERTFWLGFAVAVASNLVFLVSALLDYVVPWRLYVWLWPASVVELVAYLGLRDARDLGRFLRSMLVAVAAFGAGMLVFILWWTGWLRV